MTSLQPLLAPVPSCYVKRKEHVRRCTFEYRPQSTCQCHDIDTWHNAALTRGSPRVSAAFD
eukprot:9474272-Pyramimonas_sp.AAC.2